MKKKEPKYQFRFNGSDIEESSKNTESWDSGCIKGTQEEQDQYGL